MLGTDKPFRVYELPMGGSRDESPETGVDEHFNKAISYAVTSGSTNAVAPGAPAKGRMYYKTANAE